MSNAFTKLKKKHKILFNTFSRSLIILEPATETWAQEMKIMGALRAEQFPTLES